MKREKYLFEVVEDLNKAIRVLIIEIGKALKLDKILDFIDKQLRLRK